MGPPALLTNLSQLRRCAERQPPTIHPFRILANVIDANLAGKVLLLRDGSGTEFLRLDVPDRQIEPGATVCLEGSGCGVKPKSFGLELVPGLVADDDGIHSMLEKSGTVFLREGANPITVQWFNRTRDFGLSVEYEGPGLPRQPVPSSALSPVSVNPVAGGANLAPGLDYCCYEGAWAHFPDLTKYSPVKTGITSNFDLNVRTRNENVGLKFTGFITVPSAGVYTFHLASDDGSRLFVGESSLSVSVLSNGPPALAAAEAAPTAVKGDNRPWLTLEGTLSFVGVRGAGGELSMRAGNDDIRVEVFETGEFTPNFPPGAWVRASGFYQDVVTENGSHIPGILFAPSWISVRPVPPSERNPFPAFDGAPKNQPSGRTPRGETAIAPITTVADIKALSDEAARRGFPVSIRGVVTAVFPSFIRAAAVQDSTKGIFVSLREGGESEPFQRGDLFQIDGVTGSGAFAPIIAARRVTRLGAGQMPQPVHATWDQLVNGSLDTQYAEIEGVVTAAHGQQIEMLTDGGKITLEITDFQSDALANYENALVRIRGCILSSFDQQHNLDARSLSVRGSAVDVLQAPPRDLFQAQKKNIGELLFYDPKAAPFRRLKVTGQVIHGQPGEYFVIDGTNGVRVTTRSAALFSAGDLVEAVGFLELRGPAAELKEAVIRKTGWARVPAPTKVAPEHLLQANYSDTLVQVGATLMDHWQDGSDDVLGLQSGFLAFRARLAGRGQSVSWPKSGSRLELTGVYAPLGSRLGDTTVNGFELLLNSVADIRVLATPPWWTLKRVLILAGILAVLLVAVLIWNKELQSKVEERSRRLELEISNRQRAELQRAAEAERARIARDLHDELGTGLTEVTLLASTVPCESQGLEKIKDRLRVIADKARALVSGLDVIVWAIDPNRNSLQSFADYLGRYVTELFAATDIVCRFKIPIECDPVTLTETARHSLFLAVKEALNNVLRHALATEVELQISQLDNGLQIVVADNGRGFDWNTVRRGNGLTNLQERLQALNGQCQIEPQVGKGTIVKLIVPLPHDWSCSRIGSSSPPPHDHHRHHRRQ